MNLSLNKVALLVSDIRNQRWIVGICSLLIGVTFILVGNLQNQPGFPLDDAWIHQTYAKNLAQSGQWEFVPGQKSAGSTSPLWTMLLSIGFMVGQKTPFLWTSILSVAMLVGIALVINEILQHFFDKAPVIGLAGSILVAMDWHLLWSSASGMETLFYCLASVYIFWIIISGRYWGWLGALCGLIVWIRPDGITLLGPVILLMVIQIISRKFKLRDGLFFLIPLIGILVLYGIFNYSISGSVLPNTFYAKQMEYVSVLQQPFLLRLGSILLVPISGVGVFLVPGFVLSIIRSIKSQNWWVISAILWFLGYGVIYALRLPMTYQHGRYLIPMIPVFYIIGIIGTFQLIYLYKKKHVQVQKWIKPAVIGCFFCSLIFVVSGLQALNTDIKTIDQLMVQPALWIKNNTKPDDLIAVHDIGAMGYFSGRNIIDLAGLIQPELIPFIRDEQEIKSYLVKNNADYLVAFKDWYPDLAGFGMVKGEYSLVTPIGKEIVEIKKLR
ncbi:MAG: hypothetical protein ACYDH1_18640 [Anaerolineaceae bacterium]